MPSKPLIIGIVGLNFGRHVLAHLQKIPAAEHIRLGAVCDLDAEKSERYAKQYSVRGYTNLKDLLADPSIDAVGLFTGPVGRADLLRTILHSGKDVMTCKPFELDGIATREIFREAKSLGRIIHLNSPSPRPGLFMEKIHEWDREFNLGRPVYCRGEATASYREEADGSWLGDPARCPVAPIFRLGIYLINDLVRLFGKVDSVAVNSSRLFTRRPTPDNADLSLTFENGALGNIFASFCVKNGQQYGNSLILHYENGSIFRNCDIREFGTSMNHSDLRLVAIRGENDQIVREWSHPEGSGDYQWEAFHRAVQERDLESMPAEATAHGIEVIEAMARAEQSHNREKVGSK